MRFSIYLMGAALLGLTLKVQANENVRPAEKLEQDGYARWEWQKGPWPRTLLPAPHSQVWPVQFQDAHHTIGNNMATFQPYSEPPYFHGGCDLRVKAGADVRTPVAGQLEAGHYGYDTNPDGSLVKYWRPWPQSGDATYFEVAVVADNGIRYEFHHVDRATLPLAIVQMLNAGGGRVEAGTVVGSAIYWPDGEYHHIHYNVILPDGTRVNPEYVAPLLPDNKAPQLQGAYALLANGLSVDFGKGEFTQKPVEFVMALIDRQNENIYDHPVSLAQLKFDSGPEVVWDFRQTLTTLQGRFPHIWEFFAESIRTPQGRTLYTDGGYGQGLSLVRLKVPAGAQGSFKISLEDMAGNATTMTGRL